MAKKHDFKIYCFKYAREETSVAEALYDTTFSMTQSHKFHELLLGLHRAKAKPFSLEVYQENQTISFLFGAEGHTADCLVGYLYLNHPTGNIEEVVDPMDTIAEDAVIGVADVTYTNWDIYPSKNYKATLCGAMDPVLRSISEVAPHLKVLTQLVIEPLPSTVSMHAYLWAVRMFDRAIHILRPKYWFRDKKTREEQLEKIREKAKGKWIRVACRILIADETEEGKRNPKKAQAGIKAACETVLTGYSMQNHVDWNQYDIHRIRYGREAAVPVKERQLSRFFRPIMRMYTFEIPGMWQLPGIGNLNVRMVLARKMSPPRNLPSDFKSKEISMFGETLYRGHHIPFGIRREDRQRHMFILGKSGTGKSGLLQLLIQKDIEHGHGVGVIDPDGSLIDEILKIVPEERVGDVIVYDPNDIDYPASLNPFELVNEESRMRVATGLLEMFRIRFADQWNDRIEHLLLYTILALLSTHWTTVLSIRRMMVDQEYRSTVIPNIKDRAVKEYWEFDFPHWQEAFDESAIQPLQRMIGDFVSSEMIKNSLGQPFNKFDFRQIMDSRKILLMKISNRLLGDDNASLLGAMVMTRIYYAAMSRADMRFEDRSDFYLYVDQFDEFATASFEEVLSESRKYRLNLTLSTQNLNLLPPGVRSTIFGNVGNLISFRTSNEDSEVLAKELSPRVWASDLVNLPPREFYVKMMVGAKSQEIFSGRTVDIVHGEKQYVEECLEHSRNHYCISREQALQIVSTWGAHG
ncbi:MAG: type IV secretion system DNA-binding domain-containing protein [Bdellovibrionales bacterium]|nr:type IV secretion system DNA-binding domain-containing protein [Bdellovibrionales bacterium]